MNKNVPPPVLVARVAVSWNPRRDILMFVSLCVCLAATDCLAQLQRTLKGVDWMQHVYKQKKYDEVEQIGYKLLFDNIEQPMVLDTLSKALSRLNRPEEAAAYLAYFRRQLLESGTDEDKRRYLTSTDRRLDRLSATHKLRVARRSEAAVNRAFTDAAGVGELWMTGVELHPLKSLHAQYAWKLIGGRKDVNSNWVHNRDGIMHRSGMKYVREVDGRRGILFTGAMHDKEGVHPRISIVNVGKCKFLRVGVRGYAGGGRGESLTIEARSGEIILGDEEISTREWSDLKFDVSNGGMPLDTVSIEVRKSTSNSEGIWFDYIEFFDN